MPIPALGVRWLAAACLALAPLSAGAHPLLDRLFDCGVRLTVERDRLRLDYELGMSELTLATELLALGESGAELADPTNAINRYAEVISPILARGFIVAVDGEERSVTPGKHAWARTDHVTFHFQFHVEWPKTTSGAEREIALFDTNFIGERGFRRLAADARDGLVLLAAPVPLRLEDVPLIPTWQLTPAEEDARRQVALRVGWPTAEPAALADASDADNSSAATEAGAEPTNASGESTALRDLLAAKRETALAWLLALLGAFVFGMLHAVKPGHGKTMVAAYLIGASGTVAHAFALGAIVTFTHTGSVLFLALLLQPIAGARWADERTISFWLAFLSGLLLFWLGVTLLWRRLHGKQDLLHVHGPGGHSHLPDGSVVWHAKAGGHHHHDPHEHHGDGDHAHEHHTPRGAVRFADLVTLGISGGVVPCDDAVLLLLAAVAAGMIGEAVYLLLAFSAGLATVLVVLGILVVTVKGYAARRAGAGPWLGWLQNASAAVIAGLGLALCARALME